MCMRVPNNATPFWPDQLEIASARLDNELTLLNALHLCIQCNWLA